MTWFLGGFLFGFIIGGLVVNICFSIVYNGGDDDQKNYIDRYAEDTEYADTTKN